MTLRLLAAAFAAGALAFCDALGFGNVVHHAKEAEIEIPEWKLDLVTGHGDDWWTKHVTIPFTTVIRTALWGSDLPRVTASVAQDQQRCPILKLPATFTGAAKAKSWRSLSGEWNAGNDVTLATWEQNYLTMGFSRNVKLVSLYIRTAATGQVAFRTRPFSDKEMKTLYNWKPADKKLEDKTAVAGQLKADAAKSTEASNGTTLEEYSDFNLAIFDCVGALMYVVKEKKQIPVDLIEVYSRDGTLISKSDVGGDIMRYQFEDPSSGYLIATAEAPGINASIKRKDIPHDVELGNVLPFGFKFEEGGYKNSSALMETDYRWVLATAVQALAIFKAKEEAVPWTLFTAVEAFWVACIALALLITGGLFYSIYLCVFPGGVYADEYYYGRLAENPFLAQKDPSLLKPKYRLGDSWHQELGWPGAYGAVPNLPTDKLL